MSVLPTNGIMLYTFTQCKRMHGSAYQIDKAVRENRLFKMDSGIYSDTGQEDELEVVQWMFPRAVLTLDSAYFYHDLTDTIPSAYCMATDRKARVIRHQKIRQIFVPDGTVDLGKIEIAYNGDPVRTYDQERLLIETARYKAKIAPDLYKEVILAFRARAGRLDANKLAEYLGHFAKRDAIETIIYEEVF